MNGNVTPSPTSTSLDVQEFQFKRPIGRAPKPKKKVLVEEDYVKNVQKIIERDFFPDLPELRREMNIIEGTSSGMTSVRSRIGFDNTPSTFETPISHSNDTETSAQPTNTKPKTSMSLDKFLTKYTSEDNDSFENVMLEAEKKNQMKNAWLFDAEKKHNEEYTPNLAITSPQEQSEYKKLAITGTCSLEKDVRPKTLENWDYKVFNSVMYVPEGTEMTSEQKTELAKQKTKEIVYENTRFQENPFKDELNPTAMLEASAVQAYKNEGKVGVDGKDLGQSSRVNGYSYVKDPSPAPGVDASPFMTWGEVEGTPAQLDGSTTPLIRHKASSCPSYKLPKVSDRDELLLQLTEKASQSHRDRKAKALSAARSRLSTPKSSPFQRLASMSPAAKKLLSSTRSSKGLAASLRASYTPSPRRSQSTTPKPASIRTPNITDNLLNLPSQTSQMKRKKAADFF